MVTRINDAIYGLVMVSFNRIKVLTTMVVEANAAESRAVLSAAVMFVAVSAVGEGVSPLDSNARAAAGLSW